MSDYITTYSKVHFTPLEPDISQIRIEDIAHALSLMTRANGHFKEFYSVCQHSIGCCLEAKERGYSDRVSLACLLHDGSEAYLADITRPVKKNLDGYLQIEEVLQNVIYKRFLGSLPTEEELLQIKSVDDSMLCHEFLHYMGENLFDTMLHLEREPEFVMQPFSDMENKFLELFHELYQDEVY